MASLNLLAYRILAETCSRKCNLMLTRQGHTYIHARTHARVHTHTTL